MRVYAVEREGALDLGAAPAGWRVVRRRSRDGTPFCVWLPCASPEFDWTRPHLVQVQRRLRELAAGEIQNLMVLGPPLQGKTELATVRYPVWRLERNPRLRVIVCARNQRFADHLALKIKRIAVSRGCFHFAADRSAIREWELVEGGGVLAAGIGCGITGHAAELAVIDGLGGALERKSVERSRGERRRRERRARLRDRVWEWYVDELCTRIQQGGQKLLVSRPGHEDDLVGRILNSAEAKRWTVVKAGGW